MPLTTDELAKVVARDIPPHSYVNLGIGQPTKVADHLSADAGIVLHTENGMLNMGPAAVGDEVDPDLRSGPWADGHQHADSSGLNGQAVQRSIT